MSPEKQRGPQGQTASVDILENVPVGRSAEVFIAEHEGHVERTVEKATGEDGMPVTTTHTRPGTMVMYKPTKDGYEPRTVSVSALRLLLRQGWHERCPDCHGHHIDSQGRHSADPNLCTAREPIAVRVCPVCEKRLYDNVGFSQKLQADAEADPNVIKDDGYNESTPAMRTKASLDLHLWHKHPRQAQMMGVPPLPAALRELVQGARPA